MKIYNDWGNPGAIFEDYQHTWLKEQYFLYLELYCTDVDYFGKIIAHGRTVAPDQVMKQDDQRITEEFRRITEYLETHTDICEALHDVVSIDVEKTEGYPFEAIVKFNQVSGPIHLGTVPFKGRTTPDMLTLEWNPL